MHRRRLSRTVSLARVLLGSALAAASSCVGTPLPEPPDELPKPDFASFLAEDESLLTPVNFPERTMLKLSAGPGTVQANASVSIINLDASEPVVQVSASPQGAFSASVVLVAANDRVRIVARTDTRHSAPLDLHAVSTDSATSVLFPEALSDTGLACLSVTPSPTLPLRGTQGTLRLSNTCQGAVELTRVALRFGDQGISLSSPPARLNAGQSVALTLEDRRGPGASERLEIVLIDARASDGGQGRYAIDVFSALE